MRGKKTSKETIYQVMTAYASSNNITEIAKKLGLPQTTVGKIIRENKDKEKFAKLCAKKEEEFVVKADRIINKAINRLEKELDSDNPIPVNNLTTVIGTMYDKKALASGESTDNKSITIKMAAEIKDLAK